MTKRSKLSLEQKGSKQAAKKGAKQAAKKGAKQAAKKGGGKHDLQQEALQNAMKNAMDKDSPPHDMNDLKEEMEHKIEQKKAELEELIYQKKTHEHKLAEILQKLDKRKKDTKIKTYAFKQIAKQAASTAKIKKEAATAVLQHPSAHMTQGNVISAREKKKH